jgi:hypothetical protein
MRGLSVDWKSTGANLAVGGVANQLGHPRFSGEPGAAPTNLFWASPFAPGQAGR